MDGCLIGSLPGVWIGTQLIDRVSATALRPALEVGIRATITAGAGDCSSVAASRVSTTASA